jgi:hypothetical protein
LIAFPQDVLFESSTLQMLEESNYGTIQFEFVTEWTLIQTIYCGLLDRGLKKFEKKKNDIHQIARMLDFCLRNLFIHHITRSIHSNARQA